MIRATIEMMRMKRLISRASGVGTALVFSTSDAMRPITVRSPVLTTMPVATPSTANDVKKLRFFVSSGLSLVNSAERVCASDSPVSDELSTLKLFDSTMRMSAGILSPPFTSTMSPTTSSAASTRILLPSRSTTAASGTIFAKPSIALLA
jgi:hypothetical protein